MTEFPQQSQEVSGVWSGFGREAKIDQIASDENQLLRVCFGSRNGDLKRVAEVLKIIADADDPEAVIAAALAAIGKGVRHG